MNQKHPSSQKAGIFGEFHLTINAIMNR